MQEKTIIFQFNVESLRLKEKKRTDKLADGMPLAWKLTMMK